MSKMNSGEGRIEPSKGSDASAEAMLENDAAALLRRHAKRERLAPIAVMVALTMVAVCAWAIVEALAPAPAPTQAKTPQQSMNDHGAWVAAHPGEALSDRKLPAAGAQQGKIAPSEPFAKLSPLPSKGVDFSAKAPIKPPVGRMQTLEQANEELRSAPRAAGSPWVVDEHGFATLPNGQKVRIIGPPPQVKAMSPQGPALGHSSDSIPSARPNISATDVKSLSQQEGNGAANAFSSSNASAAEEPKTSRERSDTRNAAGMESLDSVGRLPLAPSLGKEQNSR